MNVVYEAFLSPKVGGGVRHFAGLSAALSRQGACVTELLPRPTAVPAATDAHQRTHLPVIGPRVVQMAIYETLRVLLLLWWAVRGRRFDVWMSRYSLFGVGLGLARLVAKRVVLEINGPVYEEILSNFGSKSAAAVALHTMRLQVRSAHLVVAVTPGLADYVRVHVPGTDVIAIHNGADPIDATAPHSAERDTPFVFAGALTPWYELDVVLRALALVRDDDCYCPRLRLVGDGIQKEALHRLVDELGLDDVVEFVAWIDADHVRDELTRARTGLLPLRSKGSTPAIGSPLKLYEYVAAGLTVIGTDLDGIANSPVSDAVHYYKQGDIRSCAAALRRTLNGTASATLESAAWSWDSRACQLLETVAPSSPACDRSLRPQPISETSLSL